IYWSVYTKTYIEAAVTRSVIEVARRSMAIPSADRRHPRRSGTCSGADPGRPTEVPGARPGRRRKGGLRDRLQRGPQCPHALIGEAGEQPGHYVLNNGVAASHELLAIWRDPVQNCLTGARLAFEQPSLFKAGNHRARGLVGLPDEKCQRVG